MLYESWYKKVAASELIQKEATTQGDVPLAGVVRGICQEAEPEPGQSTGKELSRTERRKENCFVPWTGGHSVNDLKLLQREDLDIGPILAAKLAGTMPSSRDMVSSSPASRHYWVLRDLIFLEHGLLYKKFLKRDGSGEHRQFIVPKSLKNEVLFQMHDSVVSGHLGCKKKNKGENPSKILLVRVERRCSFAYQKVWYMRSRQEAK